MSMLRSALLLLLVTTSAAHADEANLLRVNPSFETATGSHGNGDYRIEGWSGKNPRYGHHAAGDAAPGAGARAGGGWPMPDG